jgi:hypothetical protein
MKAPLSSDRLTLRLPNNLHQRLTHAAVEHLRARRQIVSSIATNPGYWPEQRRVLLATLRDLDKDEFRALLYEWSQVERVDASFEGMLEAMIRAKTSSLGRVALRSVSRDVGHQPA